MINVADLIFDIIFMTYNGGYTEISTKSIQISLLTLKKMYSRTWPKMGIWRIDSQSQHLQLLSSLTVILG